MTEKPDDEEKKQHDKRAIPLLEYLHYIETMPAPKGERSAIIKNFFENDQNFLAAAKKFDNTSSTFSKTINDLTSKVAEIENYLIVDTEGKFHLRQEIDTLKEYTENLNSQYAEFVNDNADVIVAAAKTKAIPALELRVKTLEETIEKKRNWTINIWLLALTILFGLATCISTIAAVWAMFLR